MGDVIYNTIGTGYNTTRKADPYISGKLYQFLNPTPTGQYLDIGCGTGNYLQVMMQKGFSMTGVDPSDVMLEAARQKSPEATFIRADLEHIPFPNSHFDGAMAVLTIHHWANIGNGLKELRRVIKPGGSLVFFSFTPEQVRGYWLAHYFPKMIERAAKGIPTLAGMENLLTRAGFEKVQSEPYFVKEDLEDHFMYSHKSRPERYLEQQVRDGASGFMLAKNKKEIVDGLELLKVDIISSHINDVMVQYENNLGDYLFIVCN